MNDELLVGCIRATANTGEFSRNTSNSSKRGIKKMESMVEVKPQKPTSNKMIPDPATSINKIADKDDEFVEPKVAPNKMVPDAPTTITKLADKMESSYYNEDTDEFIDMEYTSDAAPKNLDPDESEDVAVIDTDLSADDEKDAKPVDYVGKYVVRCPICLKPMFSDKAEGEIVCPVCDKEIEITEDDVCGKVDPVEEEAPAEEPEDDKVDEEPVDDEGSSDEEPKEESLSKRFAEGNEYVDRVPGKYSKAWDKFLTEHPGIDVPWIFDVKPRLDSDYITAVSNNRDDSARVKLYPDGNYDYRESCKYRRIKKSKKEAIVDGTQFEIYWDDLTPKCQKDLSDFLDGDNGNYDVIPVATIFAPDSLDEACKSKKAKKESSDEVCPECGKPVNKCTCECDSSKKMEGEGCCCDGKTEVKVCPEGGVKVSNDKVCVKVAAPGCEDNEVVDVDDVDVTEFDNQVNGMVDDVYDGEDEIDYETESITRNGKGIVIEGVIKSHGNSAKVKFTCNECKAKSNKFVVEGFTGIKGKLVAESSYNKSNKSLKIESISYKFLASVGGKSKVLESKKSK